MSSTLINEVKLKVTMMFVRSDNLSAIYIWCKFCSQCLQLVELLAINCNSFNLSVDLNLLGKNKGRYDGLTIMYACRKMCCRPNTWNYWRVAKLRNKLSLTYRQTDVKDPRACISFCKRSTWISPMDPATRDRLPSGNKVRTHTMTVNFNVWPWILRSTLM